MASQIRSDRVTKNKRITNACIACRSSKVRCSGLQPCNHCSKRSLDCIFADDGRKVTISERYLRHLQQLAEQSTSRTSGDSANLDNEGVRETEHEPPGIPQRPDAFEESYSQDRSENGTPAFPLPSIVMPNTHGTPRGWIYLGLSSAAAFTARLTFMISRHLYPECSPNIPLTPDGDVYKLETQPPKLDNITILKSIPSQEHCLYLVNTVKFHLSPMFCLFHETEFLERVRKFYSDPEDAVERDRLWFMQFLLVLAFGKAFLSQTLSRDQSDPPGGDFFVRAMLLLPNYSELWKDPLVAIEIFGLVALYLYSVDRKESAYLYIGHALRISQMEGLHTELPVQDISTMDSKRSRDLWWTIYMLDRQLSASLGVPISVQEYEVSTTLYNGTKEDEGFGEYHYFALKVRLTRVLGCIFHKLYRSGKVIDKAFLDDTKAVLQMLADILLDMEDVIDSKLRSRIGPSKAPLHLALLYHQCVILSMRPLLLSALTERLQKVADPQQPGRDPSSLMSTFISTAVQSATKTLQILAKLMENSLLETFLPFDLEFAVGASVLLNLANLVVPGSVHELEFRQAAYLILDEMIEKGNRVAIERKNELQRMESMFDELEKKHTEMDRASGTLVADNAYPPAPDGERPYHDNVSSAGAMLSSPAGPLQPQPGTSNAETLFDDALFADFGLSSDDLLAVVQQIGDNSGFIQDSFPDNWIWDVN